MTASELERTIEACDVGALEMQRSADVLRDAYKDNETVDVLVSGNRQMAQAFADAARLMRAMARANASLSSRLVAKDAQMGVLERLESWLYGHDQREAELGQDTGVLEWVDGVRCGSMRVILTEENDAAAGCTRSDLASALEAALDAAESRARA